MKWTMIDNDRIAGGKIKNQIQMGETNSKHKEKTRKKC